MNRKKNKNLSYNQLEKIVRSIAGLINSKSNNLSSNQKKPVKQEFADESRNENSAVGERTKWTEKWGFWANLGMLIFTAFLFFQTKTQTDNSTEANNQTKDEIRRNRVKDSLNDIYQIAKDSIDSSERIYNRRYIDSSIAIAKQSANAVTDQVEIAKNSFETYNVLAQAAKKNAEIAEKAAMISEKSAAFYKESVAQQNRAYIIIDSTNVLIDSPLSVTYYLRNIGNTPAYNIESSVMYFFKNADAFDTAWFKKENFTAEQFTIPQKEQTLYKWTSHRKPNLKYFYDFITGNDTIYLGIKIRYMDIYKNRHTTTSFNFFYSGEHMKYYPRFNEIE